MPRNFDIMKLIGEQTIKYSNLPERYIKRATEQIYYKSPRGPQYNKMIIQKENFIFDMNRPWTNEFRRINMKKSNTFHHVEPIKEWSFFIGDRVQILIGKDKDKQGTVKQIFQERNWITVAGLNTKLKRLGKNDKEGVYIQQEMPLLVTEHVSLVDPSDLCPTTIKWQYDEEGQKIRVSTRTGRIIPIPATAESTVDYKFKTLYKESPKDTLKEDVEKVTFEPALKTFEMDIMDKMGIKEDRVQKETYWY